MKRNLALLVFVSLLIGCTSVRDFLYNPIVSIDPETGIVSTNSWVLKPSFDKGISLAGDVAPVPWAGMVSQLSLGVLGIGGAMYGRKYKQAGRVLVETVDVYRQGARKLAGGEEFDKDAIRVMKDSHGSNGVGKLIASLVKTYTGKTKG